MGPPSPLTLFIGTALALPGAVGVDDNHHSIFTMLPQKIANVVQEPVPLLGTNNTHSWERQPSNDGVIIGWSNWCNIWKGLLNPCVHLGHQSVLCGVHFAAENFQVLFHVARDCSPCSWMTLLSMGLLGNQNGSAWFPHLIHEGCAMDLLSLSFLILYFLIFLLYYNGLALTEYHGEWESWATRCH